MKYSPTVVNWYQKDHYWFEKNGGGLGNGVNPSDHKDDEGYDEYGFDENGKDRENLTEENYHDRLSFYYDIISSEVYDSFENYKQYIERKKEISEIDVGDLVELVCNGIRLYVIELRDNGTVASLGYCSPSDQLLMDKADFDMTQYVHSVGIGHLKKVQ
ncbi:hypothetical protein PBI_SCTP2_421 [Salicola phage SCTP-2]|nr:hypothetical protein PBI_SCTP2_421 [Salicola phage SCTP-2]